MGDQDGMGSDEVSPKPSGRLSVKIKLKAAAQPSPSEGESLIAFSRPTFTLSAARAPKVQTRRQPDLGKAADVVTHVIHFTSAGEARERGVKRRMSSPGIAAAEGEQAAARAQQPQRKRHRLAAASRSASPDFQPEIVVEAQPAKQVQLELDSSPARQGSGQMTEVTLKHMSDEPSSAAVGGREEGDVEDRTALPGAHKTEAHQQKAAVLGTQGSPLQAAEAIIELASPKQQHQQPLESRLREYDAEANGPSTAATTEHLHPLQAVSVTAPQENGDSSAAAHSSIDAEDPGHDADVLAGHQQASADSLAHPPGTVNGEGREEDKDMQEADQMDSPLRDEPSAGLYPAHHHSGSAGEAQTPAAMSSKDQDAPDPLPDDENLVGAAKSDANPAAVLPGEQTGVSVDEIVNTDPHQEPMPDFRASENGNLS